MADEQIIGQTAIAIEPGAEPRDQSERPLRGDKKPKPRKRKREPSGAEKAKKAEAGAVKKARSKVLETKLGELMTFPAVPAAMVARDAYTQAYMIEHFTRSGPRAAAALVEASESNPQLRELLERITAGGSMFTVVLALAAYAAPPVIWTLGMREQAVKITQASTMDEAQLEAMLQAAHANAAAQAEQAAAEAPDNGAASAAPTPGPDPLDAESPA